MQAKQIVNNIQAALAESGIELTKKETAAAVKALTNLIVQETAQRGSCSIHGLGTFYRRELPAQTRRNPRTGEEFQAEATSSVGFHPSKQGFRKTVKETPVPEPEQADAE